MQESLNESDRLSDSMSMQHFIPPPNFALVEENIFRSGQPNELNLPYLEQLEIQTVLYLSPDEPSPQFTNFIDDHEIELHCPVVRIRVPPFWSSCCVPFWLNAMDSEPSPPIRLPVDIIAGDAGE